jgi:uncharacterized delta-60 repeat protein
MILSRLNNILSILVSFMIVSQSLAQDFILDSAFGNNGTVISSFDFSADINDVYRQHDGKILALGYLDSLNSYHTLITRYNTNGTLDKTFGNEGVVKNYINEADMPQVIKVQNDGKILVGGNQRFAGTFPYLHHSILVRYLSDGQLDKSFGIEGKLELNTHEEKDDGIISMDLQDDGRIVAGGFADNNFMLMRCLQDGTLDSTFGVNGQVKGGIASQEQSYINAVKLLPDGKILAAGYAGYGNLSNSAFNFALARYNPNGQLDISFGNEGVVLTDILSSFHDVIKEIHFLEENEKILVAGYSGSNIALAQYTKNGLLDSTFGNNGIAIADLCSGSNDLSIGESGKIMVCGSKLIESFNSAACIAIFNQDGTIDSLVGNNPIINDVQNANDYANSIWINNGEIFIAGSSRNSNSHADFFLSKYRHVITNVNNDESEKDCKLIVYTNSLGITNITMPPCFSGNYFKVVLYEINGSKKDEFLITNKNNFISKEITPGTYIYQLLNSDNSIVAANKFIVK